MTLTLDITGDFVRFVDNLRPVTLTLRRTGETHSITHSHRKQIRATEHTTSGGDVKAGDVTFEFPVSESVDGSTNLLGSTITDEENITYTILTAAYQVWSSKWYVTTRNLAIDAGLDTTVSLVSCDYYKHSSSGEPVETWTTLDAAVRAKIQLETASVTVGGNMDETARTYRITLESELSVIPGADYLIEDADGTVYRLQSYHGSKQLGVLPYIIAKRTE